MSDAVMSHTEQLLLEDCRAIELHCKALYDYFADIYQDNPEISRLWRKTAVEEQNHADQFTMVLRLKKGIPCAVNIDSGRVSTIIRQLEDIISRVKNIPPTLEDALLSSIKMEKHLAEFHVSCVVAFHDESYRSMFNAMMASDQEHVASLQEAYDQLTGNANWSFIS